MASEIPVLWSNISKPFGNRGAWGNGRNSRTVFSLGMLFFQFRMFLRLVAGLTGIVMLVVIAFLIHSALVAHRRFALAYRAVVGRLILFRMWTLSPFANGIMCMMGISLSSSARNTRVPRTFRIGRLFISGLRFFRMLAILVRSAGASDPLGVWMFLGHVTIDPAGSPDLWCSV